MKDTRLNNIHYQIVRAVELGDFWRLPELAQTLYFALRLMKPFHNDYKPIWVRRKYENELKLLCDLQLVEGHSAKIEILIKSELSKGKNCDKKAVDYWQSQLKKVDLMKLK